MFVGNSFEDVQRAEAQPTSPSVMRLDSVFGEVRAQEAFYVPDAELGQAFLAKLFSIGNVDTLLVRGGPDDEDDNGTND
jgi:hypothetical protein